MQREAWTSSMGTDEAWQLKFSMDWRETFTGNHGSSMFIPWWVYSKTRSEHDMWWVYLIALFFENEDVVTLPAHILMFGTTTNVTHHKTEVNTDGASRNCDFTCNNGNLTGNMGIAPLKLGRKNIRCLKCWSLRSEQTQPGYRQANQTGKECCRSCSANKSICSSQAEVYPFRYIVVQNQNVLNSPGHAKTRKNENYILPKNRAWQTLL